MIGRTQTNGPADYEKIHAFQDSMKLMPLSAWPGPAPAVAPTTDPSVGTTEPPAAVAALSGAEFFARAVELAGEFPPHLTDYSQLARLARLGIRGFNPKLKKAVETSRTNGARVVDGLLALSGEVAALRPEPCTAEICTKTSFAPPSGVIKPKPLS